MKTRCGCLIMLMLLVSLCLSDKASAQAETASAMAIDGNAACADGRDNDGDGMIDFPSDLGCAGVEDDDETDRLGNCSLKFDTDGDGVDDLVFDWILCQCEDGIDNDGDALVDYPSDPDCFAPTDNLEDIEDVHDEPHSFDSENIAVTRLVLSASDGSSGDYVELAWNTDPEARSYELFRSSIPGARGELIGESIPSTLFKDSSAIPGVHYEYRVRAVYANGEGTMSEPDAGFRRSDNKADCDADGVSDEEEQIDGTKICDAGSFQTHLRSPVYSYYNTFLDQMNFLEVAANGQRSVNLALTVFNFDGSIRTVRQSIISPGMQQDFDIRELAEQSNTYGLVRIEWNSNEAGANIAGRMVRYRRDPGSSDYSFAVSEELRNAIRGDTFAMANTFDPQGAGYLVANWGSLTNLSSRRALFMVELFDQEGRMVKSTPIWLAPFESRDFAAGHEEREDGRLKEAVYLVKFTPADGSTSYLSGVRRYSAHAAAGTSPERFAFSFAIDGRSGTGDAQFVPTTNEVGGCWSQTNWIEIANVRSDKSVEASVAFFDQHGEIAHNRILLAPQSQFHLNAGALLSKGEFGGARISSSDPQSLLTQSVAYYHNCRNSRVDAAFVAPGRIPTGALSTGTFNTNLEMKSVLFLIGVDNSSRVSASARPYDAAMAVPVEGLLPGRIVAQHVLNGVLPVDRYGTVAIQSDRRMSVAPFILRLRENSTGEADFAFQTLPQ